MCYEYSPRGLFTTLYFIHSLLSSWSCSVALHKAEKVCQRKPVYLIGPILNLWRKWSVVHKGPRDCIHKTSFSSYFKMHPKNLVLHYTMLERLARGKQSSLLGPFFRYEENEVLWIWRQTLNPLRAQLSVKLHYFVFSLSLFCSWHTHVSKASYKQYFIPVSCIVWESTNNNIASKYIYIYLRFCEFATKYHLHNSSVHS
jgi:hypothetical protein